MYFTKRILALALAVIFSFGAVSVTAFVGLLPAAAEVESTLGAAAACTGHTLGTFSDLPACVNASGELHLCDNNFPDAGFREGLREEHHFRYPEGAFSLDITSDNCLYKNTVKIITSILLDGNWGRMKCVKGIEFFENLNYLEVNSIESLDISHNKKLVRLSCQFSYFDSLDVSKNPELKYLVCSNSHFTSLDLSHNPKLEELNCSGNKLTQLDLTHNPELTYLNCINNGLEQLDLTHNAELTHLSCSNNALKQLDLPNDSKLTSLGCANNSLEQLDVSGNPALETLECYGNRLAKLDVRKNLKLKTLLCQYNSLSVLDLRRNVLLENLDCSNNMIVRLELGDVENAVYSPQYKYLALIPGETSFDMRRIIADGNLGRITEVLGLYVDPGFLAPMESVENLCEYHPETGIVTLEKEYEYYEPLQFLEMSIKLFVGEDLPDMNLIVKFTDDPDKEVPDAEPEPDAPLTDEEYIADIIVKTGDATENPSFDLVIEAPEEYRAGSEFDVTVSIANITDAEGIISLLADLYYDAEKLLLLNAVDEEGVIDCISLPDGWEAVVHFDRDTDHNIVYNGHIMLMYGREAQSKTRIASPATIPKQGNHKAFSPLFRRIILWYNLKYRAVRKTLV